MMTVFFVVGDWLITQKNLRQRAPNPDYHRPWRALQGTFEVDPLDFPNASMFAGQDVGSIVTIRQAEALGRSPSLGPTHPTA